MFLCPDILYDEKSDCFYIYGTSDGMWIAYSRDPHVAISKDLVHWEYKPINIPEYYPVCTPQKPEYGHQQSLSIQ
jgi:hypothetical protein